MYKLHIRLYTLKVGPLVPVMSGVRLNLS
eukprot:SAG22_NODE_15077_length_357_cov_1.468992_1_plen_28_part_10